MRYNGAMQTVIAKVSCAAIAVAGLMLAGCAETSGNWPAYRGQYYAFDAYPHGYKGYPAFPYYGAPFGYGGPAFAATEQTQTVEQKSTQTRHSTHRRHRASHDGRRDR